MCRPLGLSNRTLFPDSNFNASSFNERDGVRHLPFLARFGSKKNGSQDGLGWRPLESDNSSFLEIELGYIYTICAIATERPTVFNKEHITKYKIELSTDGRKWSYYQEKGKDKVKIPDILNFE